jgi:chemotaxis protein MotB
MHVTLLLRLFLALLVLAVNGCVSAGTFEKKAAEADDLRKELTHLQQDQVELVRAKSALEARQGQLAAEVALLTEQNTTCEADRKSVEEMLKGKDDALSSSVSSLRQQVFDLTGTNVSLKKDIDNLLKNRTEEVRKTSSTYEELLGLIKDEIARGEATVSELKGTLTVTLFEPLLFDPGSAKVKQSSGPTLQRLAGYLKGLKEKSIRVEGYTETVLSASWSLQQYPSGWELAAARAIAVTRFLQNEGISPLVLSAVSYGEYRPQSDNISELGRARNRRIQIVVIPKEQT